ncbi:hypothetical protein, partial [Acetomicrobium sp. S15 = DSM 107314]|uniref:hypothetical protein n=1 Tax=Acetomicrobium sp. S15 = DSM 107314 TaxID=2529858 RepID=UPI0018E1460F
TGEALPVQARVFDNRLVIESTQTGTEAAFSLEGPQVVLDNLGLDLDVVDFGMHFLKDPAVRLLLVYLEGLND